VEAPIEALFHSEIQVSFHFSCLLSYNGPMTYEFSVSSFFIGLIILAVGVTFVRFHQWVANNFGSGVASYDRYKLYAFIACGVGLLVMVNLHAVILTAIGQAIFPSVNK